MNGQKVRVSYDTVVSTEQALLRYDMLVKKAKKVEDIALNEFISESADLVKSLKTGQPVWTLEHIGFLDDINYWSGLYITKSKREMREMQ